MFPIPDLKGIAQRANNSFRANLKGTDAWLWPNNVGVAAKVFAGIVWELFCKLKEIDKQRFPDTAYGDGLDHWGRLYAIGKKAASFAQGELYVPASYPATIPQGTSFIRSDGFIYVSTVTVFSVPYSPTGLVTVPVVCQTKGSKGNCIAGTPLSVSISLGDNLTPIATASDAGIGGGADVETEPQYKARILERLRKKPMGGAVYDYDAWAKDISGVTRVFTVGNAFGRGTVGVWFLMDDTYPQGIPLQADVDAVKAYLDMVAPATADVIVSAPVPSPVDIVVKGVYPESSTVYEAVAAEMLAVFRKMATVSLPKGRTFTLRYQWLQQAVNNAAGEDYNQGVSQPSSDIPFAVGVMPVLNSVRFSPANNG